VGEYCRLDLCSGTPLSTVTITVSGCAQSGNRGAFVIPGSLLQAGGGRRRN
jgi:hypothetical protein